MDFANAKVRIRMAITSADTKQAVSAITRIFENRATVFSRRGVASLAAEDLSPIFGSNPPGELERLVALLLIGPAVEDEDKDALAQAFASLIAKDGASLGKVLEALQRLIDGDQVKEESPSAASTASSVAVAFSAAIPEHEDKKKDLADASKVMVETGTGGDAPIAFSAGHAEFQRSLTSLIQAMTAEQAGLKDPNLNPEWAEIYEAVYHLAPMPAIRRAMNGGKRLEEVIPHCTGQYGIFKEGFMTIFGHFVLMALALSKQGGTELAAVSLRLPYALYYIAVQTTPSRELASLTRSALKDQSRHLTPALIAHLASLNLSDTILGSDVAKVLGNRTDAERTPALPAKVSRADSATSGAIGSVPPKPSSMDSWSSKGHLCFGCGGMDGHNRAKCSLRDVFNLYAFPDQVDLTKHKPAFLVAYRK